ncbi:MAG: porin [Pseudomonadota bacterium]
MKKILFASTALVAFGAAAQAEVLITGNASLGVVNSEGDLGVIGGTGGDFEFFQDVDVDFTLVGETDGGLAFGANVDLDEADGLGDEDTNQGVDVFISGAFGTVTLGDTDGAVDFVSQEVGFSNGSINEDETSHAGWNGNSGLDGFFDGQILRYDYTLGDFTFAASAEIDDDDNGLDINDAVIGIGGRYNGTFAGFDFGLGLGYQFTDISDAGDIESPSALEAGDIVTGDYDLFGVTLNSAFQDVQVGFTYQFLDGPSDETSFDHFGVGVGYVFGAISVSANYGIFDFDDGTENEGYGISAGYDLGGGAAVQFGFGDSDDRDGEDLQSYSLGVRMNF